MSLSVNLLLAVKGLKGFFLLFELRASLGQVSNRTTIIWLWSFREKFTAVFSKKKLNLVIACKTRLERDCYTFYKLPLQNRLTGSIRRVTVSPHLSPQSRQLKHTSMRDDVLITLSVAWPLVITATWEQLTTHKVDNRITSYTTYSSSFPHTVVDFIWNC